MAPPATKKRKTRATAGNQDEAPQQDPAPEQASQTEPTPAKADEPSASVPATASEPEAGSSAKADLAARAAERKERFRALQARAAASSKSNLKEVRLESQRLATNPATLEKLRRKHDIATEKLQKVDDAERGEDFERKRAWDWTEEESARWDKRMKKKEAHRNDQAFQDYSREGRKVYKRQIGNLKVDTEAYEAEKMKAVERAAASGGLEIVETEDGELVAVDKDGTFYSSADTLGFVENKPPKDAVDRLVKDLQQAEDARLKKRKERGQDKEEGDVTYINEKNKNFNNKLARFYNKVCWMSIWKNWDDANGMQYTAEVRDSFERGTAI